MSNIQINDLALTNFEFTELSELEIEMIGGGGWFHALTDIINSSFSRHLDDRVRSNINGGWVMVAGVGSGGTGSGQMLQ